MSPITVRETKASKLRASARSYSTRSSTSPRSSTPSQPTSSSSKSPIKRSAVNTKKSVSSSNTSTQANRSKSTPDSTSNSTPSTSSKKYKCGECTKPLGKGNSVGCDGVCNKWYHAVCVGITDQLFKDLQRDDFSEWKCTSCLPVVSHAAVGAQHSPGPLTQAISDLRLATESNANPLNRNEEKQCHLPPVDAVTPSEQLKFGDSSGGKAVEAWMQVYNEVVRWKRNVFMPPTGKSGKDLLDEMTKLVNAWTSRSSKEPVAMM